MAATGVGSFVLIVGCKAVFRVEGRPTRLPRGSRAKKATRQPRAAVPRQKGATRQPRAAAPRQKKGDSRTASRGPTSKKGDSRTASRPRGVASEIHAEGELGE